MSYCQDRLNSQSSLECRPGSRYKSRFTHIHAPIHHNKYQPNENYFTSYVKTSTYKSKFPYANNPNYDPYPNKINYNIPSPYTIEEKIRQKVAVENTIIQSHEDLIDQSRVETIREREHVTCNVRIGLPHPFYHCSVYITKKSSVNAAIGFHFKDETYQICLLNFADSYVPGNGFQYGHKSQESSLCLQSLIYPTLVGNRMYNENMVNGLTAEGSDTMIYSQDVYLIRDEGCKRINPFLINIISSPPVNNSKRVVANALNMMETRIRKIVRLAAYKKNNILILGDFGCGPFKNDPKAIAEIFYKILVTEGYKDHFNAVVLPIYYGFPSFSAFSSAFPNALKF